MLRDDQWVDVGADNIMITRCCNSSDGGVKCDSSSLDVPGQCQSLTLPGEDPEFTWVYSTEEDATLGTGANGTGATAEVSSSTIKGKQKTTVYGTFDMPTEFLVVCKKGCP